MTDTEGALEAIATAANRLVPALTERLARHGLGEIEISHGDLRLRVARTVTVPSGPQPAITTTGTTPSSSVSQTSPVGVASPAVGYFMYADGLGPGLDVEKGDALGQVEVLGVRHDVRAPRQGTVRNLVAESGEAVEYGQVVVELEPQEAAAR